MSEVVNASEKKIVDDEKMEKLKTVKEKCRREWQLGVKVLELALCIACLGLIMEPIKRTDLARINMGHFALIFPTFSGHILITMVFLSAKAMGDKIPYKAGFIFSVLACCMFFVTSILLILDRKKQYLRDELFYEPRPYILRLLTATATFSFISSFLFGTEAVFIWTFREDF